MQARFFTLLTVTADNTRDVANKKSEANLFSYLLITKRTYEYNNFVINNKAVVFCLAKNKIRIFFHKQTQRKYIIFMK